MSTLKTDLQYVAAARHYGNHNAANRRALELAQKLQTHNLGSLLRDYEMFRTTHGATAIADALLAAFKETP